MLDGWKEGQTGKQMGGGMVREMVKWVNARIVEYMDKQNVY